ncbi:diguanylate cyclase [Zoogloea sp.]|uniref:sensor domain-containing protein n=1 Tax=Zoogloea sp. TaxID=49181 RepID=UPI0025E40947|nr:diguanylate cyclase [Zoogloea sp.]MCK6392789.1 diguanylate cyclase [Zoogloea sp.]
MERQLENRLLKCVDLLLDAVFLVDEDGHIVYVNSACQGILGYTPAEMIGRSMADFILPDDRPLTARESAQVMAGHGRVGFENRYVHKDGHTVHIMWSARWSEADRLRIGVARDVTRQKRAEAIQIATYAVSEAAHQATDLDSLFEWIHAIIAGQVPLAGLAVAIRAPRGELSFPYQRGEGGASPILDEARAHALCTRVMAEGTALHLSTDTLELASAGQSPRYASWLILPLVTRQEAIGALALQAPAGARYDDADRELLHFVSAQVATAIEHGQLKAELLRAARYDELTSLPNRRLFHDRLNTALARSRRRPCGMALLYIDIDDFKHVNDTLGHAAGDLLLQHIARRLEGCVRKADTVARLGGDEFVVILEEVHGPDDAREVADKIRSALRNYIRIDDSLLRTEASIGIAIYPENGTNAEALLKHADGGMYREKMG